MRVLIDGGGGTFGSTEIGKRVIAPFLWQKGIDQLDAVIITHPDADHYNGLAFILEHFSPGSLWIRDRWGHDNNFRNIVQLAEKKRIPVIIPKAQQKLGTENDFITCLANTFMDEHSRGPAAVGRLSNSGLVLKACSGDFCTLFPGDIEQEDERMLVATHNDLGANVLLAPHHGSATSGTPEFLAAVSPQYIIVSARKSSAGHFPHPRVLDRFAKQRIAVLTTAQHGTIELKFTRASYRLYGVERARNNPLYPMQSVALPMPSQIIPR
jgi:competence protein ComEC